MTQHVWAFCSADIGCILRGAELPKTLFPDKGLEKSWAHSVFPKSCLTASKEWDQRVHLGGRGQPKASNHNRAGFSHHSPLQRQRLAQDPWSYWAGITLGAETHNSSLRKPQRARGFAGRMMADAFQKAAKSKQAGSPSAALQASGQDRKKEGGQV